MLELDICSRWREKPVQSLWSLMELSRIESTSSVYVVYIVEGVILLGGRIDERAA